MNSDCSFGSGVNGGLVAGDSITQLVNCERMRWHRVADIVRVFVIASGMRIDGNSLDRHVAGRNRVSLKRSTSDLSWARCSCTSVLRSSCRLPQRATRGAR